MNKVYPFKSNLTMSEGFNYIFSRIVDFDPHYFGARKNQFFGIALNSLKLNIFSNQWTKFESRITKNFGSYEMDLFECVINNLGKEKRICKVEIDFIVNKCVKDINFIYVVCRVIKYNASIDLSVLLRLIYALSGNIEQLDLLINDPKEFKNIDSEKQKPVLNALLESISGLNLYNKLLKIKGPVSQNKDNFHSFLNFIIFKKLNVFFDLDSFVQYKIQKLFFDSRFSCYSIADLIKNNDFLKLSTAAQSLFLNQLNKDSNKLNSLLALVSDSRFQALSQEAQEGVFNIINLTSWNSIKNKFTNKELEELLKAFQSSSIENSQNRKKFECMLKTKSFEGLKELIRQDKIESFQKGVLSNALVLLTELKQFSSKEKKNINKIDEFPYTLTESQMKLHLGSEFQERTDFLDDRSWLKANIDTFVSKIWSRFNPGFLLTILLLILVVLDSSYKLYFMLICLLNIIILTFDIIICFPIPFQFFIEERFGMLKKELLNIFSNEENYPSRMALYHGAQGNRGALYEMYTHFHGTLNISSCKSDNQITVLRDFDDAFDEGLTVDEFKQDVENRSKRNNKRGWYDSYEYYASRAISTNTGLLGNHGDRGECTLAYWQDNFSINKVDYKLMLSDFVSRIWGSSASNDAINARAKTYNDLIQEIANLTGGTLLQILINNDNIDDVAFITEAGGIPLNIQLDGETEKTDKASKLLSLQRNSPMEYEKILRRNWRNFKKKAHICVNYYNFFATQQARVIAHPAVLSDTKKVTIFKYDAAIPSSDDSAATIKKRKKLKELRTQLKDMIREDVLRSVANGVKLEAGSIVGNKGEQPIQRYFRYVMQGVLNEIVEYKTNVQKALEARESYIAKVLEAQNTQNAADFQQAMKDLARLEQPTGKWIAINDVHAKYKDSKVRKLLMTQDLEPKDIVAILEGYPILGKLFQSNGSSGWVSYNSVKLDAIKLLESFKTQNKFFPLNPELTRMMTSIVIPFAAIAQTKKKSERNGFILPIMVNYMAKMGFNKNEILLATSLISCDTFENYIFVAKDKLQQSRAKTAEVIQLNASQCGVPHDIYFAMQYLLHITQATSRSSKFYKAAPELGGLSLPEVQPDLKEWIKELFQQ